MLLGSIAILLGVGPGSAQPPVPASGERPMRGKADPAMLSFDETMLEFMRKRHVPGGALAVVKEGRLVYARGYGWADLEKRVPAQPDSLWMTLHPVARPTPGTKWVQS